MALMDEFKEEREAIKNGPFKVRMAYFWDYYKWYVIGGACLVVFLVYTIFQIATKKDIALNGIMLNISSMEASALMKEQGKLFADENEINLDKYALSFNTSMQYDEKNINAMGNMETLQAIMTWGAAGGIDFMAGDVDALIDLAYKGYIEDFREVWPKEQLAPFEGKILYIDLAIIENRENAYLNNEQVEELKIPDATKPELMEKPVPVFVDVSDSSVMKEAYIGVKDRLVLGVAINAKNLDNIYAFLEYILNE